MQGKSGNKKLDLAGSQRLVSKYGRKRIIYPFFVSVKRNLKYGGGYLTLQEARKGVGLSQTAVADALGISVAAVCQWEQGKTFPKMKRLKNLADLYKVSVGDLLKDYTEAEV
jgi:DNA-binding XRE family transcriptional regulator